MAHDGTAHDRPGGRDGQLKGVFRAYPERTINMGIMEQTMIGVCAGLAMEGFIPVAHSITPFLVERPY